jgi:hypothetical protein
MHLPGFHMLNHLKVDLCGRMEGLDKFSPPRARRWAHDYDPTPHYRHQLSARRELRRNNRLFTHIDMIHTAIFRVVDGQRWRRLGSSHPRQHHAGEGKETPGSRE